MLDEPSPDEIREANERIQKYLDTTFEIYINGWRKVWLRKPQVFHNRIKPELTVIHYKPQLLVSTPYMPEIDGWLAISNFSIPNKKCTWLLPDGNSITIGFRPCNEHSEAWLRMKLAKASGMRFREHSMIKPDEIIYTRDA